MNCSPNYRRPPSTADWRWHVLDGAHASDAQLVVDVGSVRNVAVPRSLRMSRPSTPHPAVLPQLLTDGLAYIALNGFNDAAVTPTFDAALDRVLDASGLILDLRRNTGGNGGYAREIAARLVDRPLQFERARMRQSLSAILAGGMPAAMWLECEPDVQAPRPRPLLGPLAILTGPVTASAAEDFLVGLDGARRATLVGQPTAGTTGQPLLLPLPGGGQLMVCTRRCLYPDRREYVGRGIVPDLPVAPTIGGLRDGRDEVLEAAIAVLPTRR